ncbi:MAG: alpha/beta hydrolase [Acidobacteriota bacterium]
MTRIKKAILGIVVILFLAAAGGIWYVGMALSSPDRSEVPSPPENLAAQVVQFPSASGSTIHGWFIKGTEKAGVIILMHGVRANRSSMIERARFLFRAGYSVLLFDFQAHGESPGEQITFGYLESRDAQAAVDFVRATAPGEKIGVIGVSMGGAAAVLAQPRLNIDAIVLEMVYPTIEQATSNRLKTNLGGWASILTPLLTWQLYARLGISPDELHPIDRIGDISVAKLIIAGAEDLSTPLEESNELYSRAAAPKELWIVPGAGHVDLSIAAGEEYERRVIRFFGEHL